MKQYDTDRQAAIGESDLPTLLTIREVADVLRVSTRTIETLISKGELVPIRVGGGHVRRGLRRFTPEMVESYLVANSQVR